jgi:peptidoglycan/xylan/chitin deacetylase (PgdA/CDA1 family)
MSDHNRRWFLAALAAATVAGSGAARYLLGSAPQPAAAPVAPPYTRVPVAPVGATTPAPVNPVLPPPGGPRVALPGGGVLSSLPGNGDLLALTVDDGVNTDVVRLYTQFAKDTGVRLTYFVNGVNRSWTDNLDLLRPLVASGQIQLGNHTWSHPDLTTVSTSQVAQQITRNDRFLANTYGVDAKPFFRPPYGRHNAAVRAAAADLGYTATTMWNGSLSDSTVITEDYIAAMADKYFTPQAIVIGHLNHLPVTHVYGRLVDVIRARQLRTVTLNDVFAPRD